MRKAVRDLAQGLADRQLESIEYLDVVEAELDLDNALTNDELAWVVEAVVSARTTLDPVVTESRERLQNTVRKLSNVSGIDLSELIEEGYLTEDDLG